MPCAPAPPLQIDGESGSVTLKGDTEEACQAAAQMIEETIADPEVDKIYRQCRVSQVMPFGAFVEVGALGGGCVVGAWLVLGACLCVGAGVDKQAGWLAWLSAAPAVPAACRAPAHTQPPQCLPASLAPAGLLTPHG